MNQLIGSLKYYKKYAKTRRLCIEAENQACCLLKAIKDAIDSGCNHVFIDRKKVDLILEEIENEGYTFESKEFDQIKISGWTE
ncbi:hypothetical protein AB6831_04075 [Carnobacterium divergens]|uniref:hypothetical protein n=1 Tax=Carnobacterium divergens TaxID=2748 RepID=UPI0039C8E8D0